MANLTHHLQQDVSAADASSPEEPAANDQFAQHRSVLEGSRRAFEKAMDDDFNTANAITALFELCRTANLAVDSRAGAPVLRMYKETLYELAALLGFVFQASAELLDEDVEQLITARNEARKEKNFAKADVIRDQLKEQGILLEDTPQGIRWRRE